MYVNPLDPDDVVLVGPSRRLPLTRWQDGNDAWRALAQPGATVQVVCALEPLDVVTDAQALQVYVDRGIEDSVARPYLDLSNPAVARRTATVHPRTA